jgi:hypothetical protein
MAILATSGRNWAERTRRLAARVPDLDIFSQALVERLNGGWCVTAKGRAVLEIMEARTSEVEMNSQPLGAEQLTSVSMPRLPASTWVRRTQRLQRRRAARGRARAKAS